MASLLRICTAGSVDDGKSTLIGRLLYDSRGVYEDQVRSVERASLHRNAGPIDFSLFTDGLRAEREQGITIDVAYRYFATSQRKFILADTPGHEQYTRNMATGASTADVAILLVDARQGILDQSRRHARIASLLGISSFVIAVNKMDLVDFDRGTFEAIRDGFEPLLPGAVRHAIPISALHGDNVTVRSDRTPWFEGASLLEHLERVEVVRNAAAGPFRFPVQLVSRPSHDFRGYAGQIVSGLVRVGDPVTAWPSRRTTTVKRIVTWDGDLDLAFAPMSVTLVLEGETDISRGDVLADDTVSASRRFEADVVWMDERPLDPARLYRLKHPSGFVNAHVDRPLQLNEIARVSIEASRPLLFDRYTDVRGMGSFVLVDPATNFTAGAGMIANPLTDHLATRHRDLGGPPCEGGTRGGDRGRRRRRRPAHPRGPAVMTNPVALVADELAAAARPCVTSSFQAECVVLVHMLRARLPQVPVLFLDTVHHFPETYAYRDALAEQWGLNLVNLRAAEPRPGEWRESTTACCARHKVGPLFAALEPYDYWFTGLRREQSPSRAGLEQIESFRLPTGTVVRKVSPLAHWTTKQVWDYARAHDIPLLPLYAQGYSSIGCEPCTTKPLDPENARSGRWAGTKLECGIHIQS